jgi:predicted Zn finger-like uncharacterized protein
MIIQCEQCRAKFRLDDSRVTGRGIKVRCSRCKHLFTVTREPPEAEPPDFASSHEQTPTTPQEEALYSAPPLQDSEAQEPSIPFSFSTDVQEEASGISVNAEPSWLETATSDSTIEPPVNDEFTPSTLEDDESLVVENDEVPSTEGEIDFDTFDFGYSGANADEAMIQQSPEPVTEVKEAAPGLDISDDDMLWAETAPPTEEPADVDSFDSGADSFADSLEMGDEEEKEKSSSLVLYGGAEDPFRLEDIGFGDEPAYVAGEQIGKEELKLIEETPFAPPVEADEKPAMAAEEDLKKIILPVAGDSVQDDLPPLLITSRRKQSPLFVGLTTAVVLLLVGVLGYFGITSLLDDRGKVIQEAGRISLRAVKAFYVKNIAAGSLLVISGEAVNEYPAPRAALQVKGMIFDAKGEILASKSAFGGNLLTDQQLATLPLEKIEAVMANQFGDSLVNLEVAPGKAVPFMVVIAAPSKAGKDFGVEPTGSTVASAKLQQ